MHNIRKIKKKKKAQPVVVIDPSPQETLIQISNSKQEEFDAQATRFIENYQFSHKKASTNASKKLNRGTQASSVTKKLAQNTKLRRHATIQQQNREYNDESNVQYYRYQSTSARFIYLKNQLFSHSASEKGGKKYSRSKTVFSEDESTKKLKTISEFSQKQIKGNELNLKGAINAQTINFVPPFIVRNIKLSSRYPPIYLQ